jgi:hypothetical protein
MWKQNLSVTLSLCLSVTPCLPAISSDSTLKHGSCFILQLSVCRGPGAHVASDTALTPGFDSAAPHQLPRPTIIKLTRYSDASCAMTRPAQLHSRLVSAILLRSIKVERRLDLARSLMNLFYRIATQKPEWSLVFRTAVAQGQQAVLDLWGSHILI